MCAPAEPDGPPDRFAWVEVASSAELRSWLEVHHAKHDAVWLVTWKKAAGDRYIATDEVLDELVAHGWIDGTRRRVDDRRTRQLISPRRTRPWAASYKRRAERLIAEGRMHPAGQADVDRARATGAWDAMADVDALVVPDDLREALAASPPAGEVYDGFPPSVRRNILRWVASARTPPTRAKRIALTVEEAAAGRRVRSNG